MEISEEKYKELKVIEANNILAHAIFDWIEMILDGKEVDDFALSFLIVRRVHNLKMEKVND